MTDLVAVVCERGRLADTVSYAIREARDVAREEPTALRFVVPVGEGGDCLPRPAAMTLVERVRDLIDDEPVGRLRVDVDLVTVTGETPRERVLALLDALPDAQRLVLMPELSELVPARVVQALRARGRVGAVAVERAPVGRRIVRPPVALPGSARRSGATFAVSLAFYLSLGDPTSAFDLVTGVVSAAVVTAVLARVTFEHEPSLATLGRLARAVVFLPYLLVAVARANVAMAAVVLDPRLPIDPQIVRVPAPEGRVARALLANSITLTPGTLTVDVVDDELVVHALTAGSRADLAAGDLARAVAFVVDGRRNPGAAGATGGD